MTFEEFLIRKKIDPVQLRIAEPGLFFEFKDHYGQMGEKSFDHSKKFWFNKLRRSYHLEDQPKPTKVVAEINPLASQAEPLISPTLEATGYKPRFRSGASTSPADPARSEENTISKESPKPAYKPRFKPLITKPPQKED